MAATLFVWLPPRLIRCKVMALDAAQVHCFRRLMADNAKARAVGLPTGWVGNIVEDVRSLFRMVQLLGSLPVELIDADPPHGTERSHEADGIPADGVATNELHRTVLEYQFGELPML